MSNAILFSKAFGVDLRVAPPLPVATPYIMLDQRLVRASVPARKSSLVVKPTVPSVYFEGFWDTFKNSLIMNPNRLDLGVSADATIRHFEVWHTFITPLVINDIVQVGTRGMTLTRSDGGTKDTIRPLGLAKYTLHVGLQTDTVIDGSYTWKTTPNVIGAVFEVTGSRIVPWPYVPEGAFTETREWLTDVIRTRKKEQRLSLRRGPRKTISHSYLLGDNDLSNMWSHDKVWVNQTYAVPDWTKFIRIGPISKGTMELNIKALELGLVASGFAFIYENNYTYEVRPIKAVQTDRVEFLDGISRDYNDATILVVELQKHGQPMGIVRTAMGVSVAQTVWETLDDTIHSLNPFPIYLGRPVVTDHVLMNGNRASERFGYDLERIDSDVGLYTDFQEYDWETQTRGQLRWSCDTKEEYERVRNFLDYCRGKQKEFFVPTWNDDFIIAQDIKASESAIQIEPNAVTLFFKPFHIMLEYVDGSRDFVGVTGASRGADFDTLQITPALSDTSAATVTRISRINLMRFDTDRFEFQHKDTGVVDVSAPIVTVPE